MFAFWAIYNIIFCGKLFQEGVFFPYISGDVPS
jgi:hypothetical protein